MWGIVHKDLCQMGATLRLMIVLILCLVIYAGVTEGGFGVAAVAVLMFGTIFATRSCYGDDRHNALSFLRTLPIRQEEIVQAKYAGTALAVLGSMGIAVLTTLLFPPLGWAPPLVGDDLVGSSLLGMGMALVMGGVFLLLYFRLGYSRADMYTRIILLLLVFGVVGVVKALNAGDPLFVFSVGTSRPVLLAGGVFLVGMVWYGCSLILAIRAFSRQ